ncbi:uncharacterized protein C10orf95-like [Phasianus colchicus]|uniref:uncharacterized protein C10orf95-like n=1 Tax=Phasianus colchicus TaxID=9054 RepID=UPI00129EAD23|nr:uncharacterized protein C10orf95-like [Phasianus colchicus]
MFGYSRLFIVVITRALPFLEVTLADGVRPGCRLESTSARSPSSAGGAAAALRDPARAPPRAERPRAAGGGIRAQRRCRSRGGSAGRPGRAGAAGRRRRSGEPRRAERARSAPGPGLGAAFPRRGGRGSLRSRRADLLRVFRAFPVLSAPDTRTCCAAQAAAPLAIGRSAIAPWACGPRIGPAPPSVSERRSASGWVERRPLPCLCLAAAAAAGPVRAEGRSGGRPRSLAR